MGTHTGPAVRVFKPIKYFLQNLYSIELSRKRSTQYLDMHTKHTKIIYTVILGFCRNRLLLGVNKLVPKHSGTQLNTHATSPETSRGFLQSLQAFIHITQVWNRRVKFQILVLGLHH